MESMQFDVLIVGGGPAGLATACQLKKQATVQKKEISVAVLEKGSRIGSHILSGAIFDPKSLDELFPNWKALNAPVKQKVKKDKFFFLSSESKSYQIPHVLIPPSLKNKNHYIISLGDLCEWLAIQAESLGVDIFTGFSASEIIYDNDKVIGVKTGGFGLNKDNQRKSNYTEGINIYAKKTVFSEGCRGHLGKELVDKFYLNKGKETQQYALGIKEIWEVPEDKFEPGLAIHTIGWPLLKNANGGGFMYHLESNKVVVGLVVDLDYRNPTLSPFHEMQKMKKNPTLKFYLENGHRISYGAKTIAKGGINSLPLMDIPGAVLIGCDAGTLNPAKIKGIHCAMKSGIIAADTVLSEIYNPNSSISFMEEFDKSWLYDELYCGRNFLLSIKKYGMWLGGALNYIEQVFFKGKSFWNLSGPSKKDGDCLVNINKVKPILYDKPDNVISFDKLSSVYLSNTYHEEDQPSHLILKEENIPIVQSLPRYGEPSQYYCPAGVYEVVDVNSKPCFQINFQNCLHCKTCDIKDPFNNIKWTPPEGGGGPNYISM